MVLLAGLGLGYLYFLRQPQVFQSSAQILVVEKSPQLPVEAVQVSDSYDATHAMLIRSPMVVRNAVEKHNLDELPALAGDPVSQIMAGLSASADGGRTGDVAHLTYQSSNQESCQVVLQAVVDAYQEFLGDLYRSVSTETTGLITKARQDLDQQVSLLEEDYRKFQQESPLLFMGETAKNVHEARLVQIETFRSEAVLENSRLRARITSLEEALERGADRDALNLLAGDVTGGESLRREKAGGNGGQELPTVEQQIFPLLLEEQALLQRVGPDHPKIIALHKKIEMMRAHAQANPPRKIEPINPTAKPREHYEIYLESLREQARMNVQTIKAMDELFEKEREASKALASYQIADETFRSEIDRKSRLFDAVLKRLEEINLVKDTGGAVVHVVHPPAAGYQIKPNFQSTMITAGLLSTFCGLLLAFAVDAADRRYRTPDEIRNDLAVQVVGHIPLIKDNRRQTEAQDGQPAPELRTVHAPRGRIAEAYRAVRTAIYFSTRGGGHQVIQITSPNPRDGKTTLAANLAVSIANTGKSVLLIDADFRRPRCHRLFGMNNEAGMTALIDGEQELADLARQTQVENLSLLTCGTRPENPSELLTSRRFADLLTVLREKYELVIVDTPPVMAVTDPLNVAPRVDGVLVVLRLSKSARTAGRRTLDALEEVGANILGVVVNGVGGGGGSYGDYGYGRGGYGYGRGYGDRSYEYGDAYGGAGGNGNADDPVYYGDERETSAEVGNEDSNRRNGKE